MKKIILTLLLTLTVIAPFAAQAMQAPASGAVYDTPPFNVDSKLFTSRSCPVFDCSKYSSDSERLGLANACASSRFGFPANMLTSMPSRGVFKNCAVPSSFMPKSPIMGANANWPVCCVEEKSGNQCDMTCHFYVSTTYQP